MTVPSLVLPVVAAGQLARREHPTLQAEGLTLRGWVPTDLGAVCAAYADRDIQRWHVKTMTVEEAAAWIAAQDQRWLAETAANWAVTDAQTVVGRVGLRTIDLDRGEGEVVYWVLPAARGKSVGSRAVDAMANWLFDDLGLHRLELRHSIYNTASCRVAAKAGFELEGISRQEGLHLDGWHDMHVHGRVAERP